MGKVESLHRETILISGISLNKRNYLVGRLTMKTLIRFFLFRLLEDKTRKLGKTVDHTIASDADFEVGVLLASRRGFYCLVGRFW